MKYSDQSVSRKQIISLDQLSLLHLDPCDFIACAASAGFEFVGLRLLPLTPAEEAYCPALVSGLTERIAERLAVHGVRILDWGVIALSQEFDLKFLESIFRIASSLGAQRCIGNIGELSLDAAGQRLAEIDALAGEFGMTFGLESLPWSTISSIDMAVKFIERCSLRNVRVVVDTLHWFRSMDDVDTLKKIPAELVSLVQISDIRGKACHDLVKVKRDAREDRLYPGQGDIPLARVLTALPASIPISIEIPSESVTSGAISAERHAVNCLRRTVDVVTTARGSRV